MAKKLQLTTADGSKTIELEGNYFIKDEEGNTWTIQTDNLIDDLKRGMTPIPKPIDGMSAEDKTREMRLRGK